MAASTAFNGAGRIDTHHHIIPPRGEATVQKQVVKFWLPKSLDDHLEFMDKNMIQTAVLSPSPMEDTGMPEEEAVQVCQEALDEQEAAIRRNPLRFGALALLPLPHIDGSLAFIDSTKSRIIDGFCCATAHGGKYIGDSAFDPVLEKLNELGSTLFVHPVDTVGPPNLKTPPFVLEFPTDTARTILSLIVNGSFTRFPRIKFLFAHNGGTFPFIWGRTAPLTPMIRAKNDGMSIPEIFATANIFFDTAISQPDQWSMVRNLGLPASHIIHATDFPFTLVDGESYKLGYTSVVDSGLFTADEVENIGRENALKGLFPRLQEMFKAAF